MHASMIVSTTTTAVHAIWLQLGNRGVMDVHWNIWTPLVLKFLLYASYNIGKTEIETDRSSKMNFMVLGRKKIEWCLIKDRYCSMSTG